MTGSLTARREVVGVCRRFYDRGLIAGPEGNISVRLAPDRLLVTPSDMSKVDVAATDLVEVTMAGARICGRHRPSSEIAIHLRIYARRPDVRPVVHAHPPVAAGFAVAGEGLPECVLPELICQVGAVPLVPYGSPGTEELADRFEPYLGTHDAFLMAHHGAATAGPSLLIAPANGEPRARRAYHADRSPVGAGDRTIARGCRRIGRGAGTGEYI